MVDFFLLTVFDSFIKMWDVGQKYRLNQKGFDAGTVV